MPDPVSTADAEDILAQVRRIVLEEAPREAARIAPPTRAPARTRLVLTPAQRVGEEPEGGALSRVGRADEPAPRPVASRAPTAPLLLCDPLTDGAGRTHGIEAVLGAGAPKPDGSEALARTLGGLGASADSGVPPLLRHRAPKAAPEPAPPVPLPLAAQPQPAAEGSPALDEDRLRALVVEAVRAELRGELGERITRNLRKLVRREVFRALESREEP